MVSTDCQILTHNGLILSDLSTLDELDTVYMTLPVEGGKKKKKVFSTKKKNKHKHIREKLATLRVTNLDFYNLIVLHSWRNWKSSETKKRMPCLRKRSVYGQTHGQTLLWKMPHDFETWPRHRQGRPRSLQEKNSWQKSCRNCCPCCRRRYQKGKRL